MFFREITIFTSRLSSFDNFFCWHHEIYLYGFETKKHTATYGIKVRGSVFTFGFRISDKEFESVEIFPGFAQLLV